MPLQEPKYKYNQGILKVYANKKIKFVAMNVLRTKGIEDDTILTPKGTVNTDKLDENIIRAKSKIFELAFCNPWEWFGTFTLDQKKYNRYDLQKYHKDFSQWITNFNKRNNCHIKFLVIPETHQDGAWHMHGFIMGLPFEYLTEFTLQDKLPKKLIEKMQSGEHIYNWVDYQNKFGFCDFERIRNEEAVSKYVTKYISKNLTESVKEINAHLYYHSRGLAKAIEIKKGTICGEIVLTYENEYCKVGWYDYNELIIEELKNLID